MQTFKEYLNEYASKSNALIKGIADIKSGTNGKSWNRINNRKNPNTVPKGDSHKSQYVNNIVTGKAKSINLSGDVLLNVLNEYGVDYKEGETKILGNSSVEVSMYVDNNGNMCGVLRKRNG